MRLLGLATVACVAAISVAATASAQPHCPPGQAKKGKCEPGESRVPPGQAKKWAKGQPLPAYVHYVPYRWSNPAPMGYEYIQVDDDVLLMEQATRVIVNLVMSLR
ncbi:MAG TPA: hypothetical protein VEC14_02785 [Reyranellaceae bacterium]|nr:hypothetical protein [Reyranellaceae bacterium]